MNTTTFILIVIVLFIYIEELKILQNSRNAGTSSVIQGRQPCI